MIALNNGWLATRLGACGGSVTITSHAASADGGKTPCPPNPRHLARPQPTTMRYPPCFIPGHSFTLIIPRWATSGGATVLLAVASPSGGEDSARNTSTWLRFCAHVECFETAVCFSSPVLDYAAMWLLCQESCLVCLADTTSHWKDWGWNKEMVFNSHTNKKKVKWDRPGVWNMHKGLKTDQYMKLLFTKLNILEMNKPKITYNSDASPHISYHKNWEISWIN